MTRDEVLQVLRDKAVEMLDVDAHAVQEDTSFARDLEVDSLLLVEYTLDLEDAFGIELCEQDLAEVRTVGGFADVVESRLAAKR